MEIVTCRLCGSAEASPVYTLSDYLLKRADVTAQLVRCLGCGLVYQNPRPALAEMAAHYPPEYESYTAGSAGASWLLRQAFHYGHVKRTRFVTRFHRTGRLLDVGCATGEFLGSMRALGGWEVTGVEVNDYAARIARETYGLDVRTGTLEQVSFPTSQFDVVTMWDVLEHLHEPLASVREIHRILKPDGLLLARVPNLASRDARLFGRFWAGLDAPRHLFVFSPATLRRLLEAGSFRPLAWDSGIGAYTTFLLSLRFWAAAQERPSRLRDGLIRLLYHPLLRLLSAPVFYVRGRGLNGPSLVVIARKQAAQTAGAA